MELNIKIIEGVKEFPSLYKNNNSLDDRKEAWKQLAKKLQIQEQLLKIRWHFILQRYQRDVNFKYANKMDFVSRNTEKEDNENWPEFIITEDYLKDDDSEDQEQFVFLDAEAEACNIKSLQETVCQPNEKAIVPGKEIKNVDEIDSNVGKELQAVDEKAGKAVCVTSSNEAKEYVTSSGNVNTNDPSGECYEKSKPLTVERGEDVIFGELVSAMLKRMDEDKKKNIKREIMNLLFS